MKHSVLFHSVCFQHALSLNCFPSSYRELCCWGNRLDLGIFEAYALMFKVQTLEFDSPIPMFLSLLSFDDDDRVGGHGCQFVRCNFSFVESPTSTRGRGIKCQ